MIAGLPPAAWLLLIAATVPGLAVITLFYLTHRPGRTSKTDRDSTST